METDRSLIRFIIESTSKQDDQDYDETEQFQIDQVNIYFGQLVLNAEISVCHNQTLISIITTLFQKIYEIIQLELPQIDYHHQITIKVGKYSIKPFQYNLPVISLIKQIKYQQSNISTLDLKIKLTHDQLTIQIQNDWFRIHNQSTTQTFCKLERDNIEVDILILIKQTDDDQIEIRIKKLDQSYLYINMFTDIQHLDFKKIFKHDQQIDLIELKFTQEKDKLKIYVYDSTFVDLIRTKYQHHIANIQTHQQQDHQQSQQKFRFKRMFTMVEDEKRQSVVANGDQRQSRISISDDTNHQQNRLIRSQSALQNSTEMISLIKSRISINSDSQSWRDLQRQKLIQQFQNKQILTQYQSTHSKQKHKVKLTINKLSFVLDFVNQKNKQISFFGYEVFELKQENTQLYFKVNQLDDFKLIVDTEQQMNYLLSCYDILKQRKFDSESIFQSKKVCHDWLISNQKVQWNKQKNYIFCVFVSNKKPKNQKIFINIDKEYLIFKDNNNSEIKMLDLYNIKEIKHNYKSLTSLKLKQQGLQQKFDIEFANFSNLSVFKKLFFEYKMKYYRIQSQELKVWISTYNCGESKPGDWLFSEPHSWLFETDKYDLIVIGLQECNTTKWNMFLQKIYRNHKLVSIQTMWKMMIMVFVRNPLSNLVSNIQTAHLPTGIAKVVGNKGGVAVSFRILNSSYMFISSHLAARPSRLEIRIQNYLELVQKIKLGNPNIESISQFDYVFFIGDMNFRIDQEFKQVQQLCSEQKYSEILKQDQLLKNKAKNRLFGDFEEPAISFRPTYRRMKDSDEFSNKKEQSPSYTDRILYRNNKNHKLQVLQYNSKEYQYGSDHRPVYAIFNLECKLPSLDIPLYLESETGQVFTIQINLLILDLKLQDDQQNFGENSWLTITFQSQILNNVVNSGQKKYNRNSPLKWKQSQIPLLTTVSIDIDKLKTETINLIYSIGNEFLGCSQILIGPVLDQLDGCFYDKIKYQGNHCGNLFGKLEIKQENNDFNK